MEDRTIFIARHGSREDFDNPEWIRHAENPYDPGLSPRGVREAQRLGRRAARERISYIYSSPYLRAARTAHYCARELQLPIRIEAGFGEWLNVHWFEHRPRTASIHDLKKRFPGIDDSYRSVVEPEFPESKAESLLRFSRTIELVLGRTDNGILIVGHGATLEGVAAALLQGRFNPIADPASLSRLDLQEGSWRLTFMNDTSFV